MAETLDRLKGDMDKIVRSNPLLHLATVSILDRLRTPHSSTVWFAPEDELDRLYWLSAPSRVHSEHIESFQKFGGLAPVSGSVNLPTRPSQPVLGMSFEGQAFRVDSQVEREHAIGVLVTKRVIFPDEAEAYLTPPGGSTMPQHAVYMAEVDSWTHFDGLLPPENRKTVLSIDV
jgi:hypothetical protein